MDENAVLADLAVGLPADVERYYRAGDFAAANLRIDALLTQDRLPAQAKNALLACREIMRRIPQSYTLTRREALTMLRQDIPDFTEQEFDALLATDRIDWRYVKGQPRYLDRFADALRLYPDMKARGLQAEDEHDWRNEAVAAMHAQGGLTATITLKATISPAAPVAPDAELEAWLPLPAACEQQSEIEIFNAIPGGEVAEPDAPQRTIYWHGPAGEGIRTVTYCYKVTVPYHDMDTLTPADTQPSFYTHEEAPHILFTPWLRALCEEITKDCPGPLEKARAIYDYVTLNCHYRYQPAYICLESIADGCAKDGWGDCGVLALLFITLCRIAGIPARWQSGLYVTPDHVGPHDWAQFYLEPYGWLWADCSFGVGAHRMGNEERRRHYFGNLDPLRMVANRAFYAQLTPPDEHWRNDPYDNQIGELVVNGQPLHGEALHYTLTPVDFRWDPMV